MTTQQKNKLEKIHKRKEELYKELSNFNSVTRARRIKINIMLDQLANEERRIINLGNYPLTYRIYYDRIGYESEVYYTRF